jgi:hypothetical protein
MTTADEMPDNKNLRGDDVDSMIGGEDANDVNIDDDAENKKTGVAAKKETDSYDAEITLDPVSKAGLLSDYDAQWPKTPYVPSSSKTSTTGDNPNLDEHHVAEDDEKEYNMGDVGKDANEVDGEDDVDANDDVDDDEDDDDEDVDVDVDEDIDVDEDVDVDVDEDVDVDADVDVDQYDSNDALCDEEDDDESTDLDESMDNEEEAKYADDHVAKAVPKKSRRQL